MIATQTLSISAFHLHFVFILSPRGNILKSKNTWNIAYRAVSGPDEREVDTSSFKDDGIQTKCNV